MEEDDPRTALERDRAATLARLEELTADLARLVADSTDVNADDEHDPEGSTIAFERAQLVAVVDATRRHLEECDAGLARMAAGDYGRCASCGEPIPPERLAARPTATMCVRCSAGSGTRHTGRGRR